MTTTPTTSDELAFLTTIAAAPGDDTARLVYADWLDEHDQGDRAEFVRAAVRVRQDLALMSEGFTKFQSGWLGAVLGSYAVTLSSFPTQRKVPVIKAIRDATGWGLGEAVYAAENLPRKICLTARKLVGHPFTFRVLMPHRNLGSCESLQRPMLFDEANQLGGVLRSFGCQVVVTSFVVAPVPRVENPNELPLIYYNQATGA